MAAVMANLLAQILSSTRSDIPSPETLDRRIFQEPDLVGHFDDTMTANGIDSKVGTARPTRPMGLMSPKPLRCMTYLRSVCKKRSTAWHNIQISTYSISSYAGYNGTVAMIICDSTATTFTIDFRATNVLTATAMLHRLYMTEAEIGGASWATRSSYLVRLSTRCKQIIILQAIVRQATSRW